MRVLKYPLKGVASLGLRLEMSIDNNPNGPHEKREVTIDLVILVLKEHERSLDEAINKLEQIPQRFDGIGEINDRLEAINCNLEKLCNDLNRLKTLVFQSP